MWNNQSRAQETNRKEGLRQAGVHPETGVSDQSLLVSPGLIWGIFIPFGWETPKGLFQEHSDTVEMQVFSWESGDEIHVLHQIQAVREILPACSQ